MAVSGSGASRTIDLSSVTGTAGAYLLTLTASGSGIQDAAGNALSGDATDSWTTDTTAPTADIVDVTPDPRNTNAGTVTINFNESVTGVDIGDLTLTRGGNVISLAGLAIVQLSSSQYTIDLSSVTATPGTYDVMLAAAGSGVQDSVGNPLTIAAADQWTVTLPSVSLSAVLDLATATATVTAMLSSASSLPVTIDLGFSGTATLDVDYTRSGTQIVIAANDTTGTITLTAVQDSIDEPDETVIVDINAVTNGTEQGAQQVTITIPDDDPPPTVSLSAMLDPSATVATVMATLSGPSGFDVTVLFAFSGTATRDDDYVPSGSQVTIPAGSTVGTITLAFQLDDVEEGDETAIVEITQVLSATVSAEDEVAIVIPDAPQLDFADAPDSYGTLRASDGARHAGTGPVLGALRDLELIAAPSPTATGDDLAAIDDEDGVDLPATLVARLGARARVTASAAAQLDAWIDFDGNGRFDATDQIADDLPVAAGVNDVFFAVPASAVSGASYARFRLSSAGVAGPTGEAVDGEVEDYAVSIMATTGCGVANGLLDEGAMWLVCAGTPGNDRFDFDQRPVGTLRVRLNRGVVGTFPLGAIDRIYVFGREGNDRVRIGAGLAIETHLYGDEGNDRLQGGSGGNVLVGGPGNDRLVDGLGRDVLIGGFGADRLFSRDDADLMVHGSTPYDALDQTLSQILAEWRSSTIGEARVETLLGAPTGEECCVR